MKLKDYPAVVKNCFTLHTLMRAIGFASDDIFVEPARNEQNIETVFVKLAVQGKEFRAIAGPLEPLGFERLEQMWIEVATKYNNHEFTDAEVDACVASCLHPGARADLVIALVAKGITLPTVEKKSMLHEARKMN